MSDAAQAHGQAPSPQQLEQRRQNLLAALNGTRTPTPTTNLPAANNHDASSAQPPLPLADVAISQWHQVCASFPPPNHPGHDIHLEPVIWALRHLQPNILSFIASSLYQVAVGNLEAKIAKRLRSVAHALNHPSEVVFFAFASHPAEFLADTACRALRALARNKAPFDFTFLLERIQARFDAQVRQHSPEARTRRFVLTLVSEAVADIDPSAWRTRDSRAASVRTGSPAGTARDATSPSPEPSFSQDLEPFVPESPALDTRPHSRHPFPDINLDQSAKRPAAPASAAQDLAAPQHLDGPQDLDETQDWDTSLEFNMSHEMENPKRNDKRGRDGATGDDSAIFMSDSPGPSSLQQHVAAMPPSSLQQHVAAMPPSTLQQRETAIPPLSLQKHVTAISPSTLQQRVTAMPPSTLQKHMTAMPPLHRKRRHSVMAAVEPVVPIPFREAELQCLGAGKYLNDTVLQAVITKMVLWAMGPRSRVHAVSSLTLIAQHLTSRGRADLTAELNDYDVLLLPVHDPKDQHWLLFRATRPRRQRLLRPKWSLDRFDSLSNGHDGNDDVVCAFLARHNIQCHMPPTVIPCTKQPNGFDCGVYVAAFVECLLHNLPTVFPPLDSDRARQKMFNGLVHPHSPCGILAAPDPLATLGAHHRHQALLAAQAVGFPGDGVLQLLREKEDDVNTATIRYWTLVWFRDDIDKRLAELEQVPRRPQETALQATVRLLAKVQAVSETTDDPFVKMAAGMSQTLDKFHQTTADLTPPYDRAKMHERALQRVLCIVLRKVSEEKLAKSAETLRVVRDHITDFPMV